MRSRCCRGTLSNEAFLDWGWRCAFLVSILLLLFGLFIRLRLIETPEFSRIRDNYHVSKLPLAEVVRDYGGNIVLGWLARMGEGAVFTVYTIYMFSYLTAIVHLQRTAVLASVTAAALVLIFTTPLASAWSDRVGRRRLFAIAVLVNGVRGVSFVLDAAVRQHAARRRRHRDFHRFAVGAGIRTGSGAVLRVVRHARALYRRVAGVSDRRDHRSWRRCRFSPRCWCTWDSDQPWALALYVFIACCVSALSASLMRRTFGAPVLAVGAVAGRAPMA